MRRAAIILFNLGGPDSLDAVRPFLRNLFSDPAIIGAPAFIRLPLAAYIAYTRTKSAQANYAHMGGRSPILFETEAQAAALQNLLNARLRDVESNVIVAMRYWKPFIADAADMARDWGANEVVLLPLYPQFSSTTTGSALTEWKRVWPGKTRTLCCYPAADKFIQAHADAIMSAWKKAAAPPNPRVLFSAHGLPQRIVDKGDPYQWQIEQTVAAVRQRLPREWESRICYQSRVGRLKWLEPSTEHEIAIAGADRAGVIVSPIAFVSEHVETLVELDRDYAALAKQAGVPFYIRAPALSTADDFISSLADHVTDLLAKPEGVYSETGARICPRAFGMCPKEAAA
jgi:protoporphyrin/coproporphyrin ferrochelatase